MVSPGIENVGAEPLDGSAVASSSRYQTEGSVAIHEQALRT